MDTLWMDNLLLLARIRTGGWEGVKLSWLIKKGYAVLEKC